MKTIINHALFLFCALSSCFTNAQFLEPQIKFDLYFQDAIGNMDTVTLGFDQRSDGTLIDTIFGEKQLRGVPFDSVFEVRGAATSGYTVQSNPIVHHYNPIYCTTLPNVQYLAVYIYARHWPIIITWDSTYFDQECLDWTHFTRHHHYLFNPGPFNGDIRLLKEQSKLTVYEQYMQQTVSFYNSRLEPIEGSVQDTAYNLWLGLCGYDPAGTISTGEPNNYEGYLKVSPNPASQVLQLTLPEDLQSEVEDIIVSDALGQQTQLAKLSQGASVLSLEVTPLPPGWYVGSVRLKGERHNLRFRFLRL
jgi:hypothetical protein